MADNNTKPTGENLTDKNYDDKQRALDSSGRERFGSLGRALLGSLPPFLGGGQQVREGGTVIQAVPNPTNE